MRAIRGLPSCTVGTCVQGGQLVLASATTRLTRAHHRGEYESTSNLERDEALAKVTRTGQFVVAHHSSLRRHPTFEPPTLFQAKLRTPAVQCQQNTPRDLHQPSLTALSWRLWGLPSQRCCAVHVHPSAVWVAFASAVQSSNVRKLNALQPPVEPTSPRCKLGFSICVWPKLCLPAVQQGCLLP